MKTREVHADVVVVGGGTAGTMASIKAKLANPDMEVLLLEKAMVRRSGALAMGMDGVNNAVIPGKTTPEQYVREITIANDGIVNQRAVMQTATRGFDMIKLLESWGVLFQKDVLGEYDVKQVHRVGAYVLPMPLGKDLKKILARQVRRTGVTVTNRVMATRVLVDRGRAVGVTGVDCRTGDLVIVRARAVVLCLGAAGRMGLPASGFLWGTYENPTNAGDGHAMAYHAGAALTNLECFQINPLIKDYNGPACAYVTAPFGGHTVNSLGHRFIDCDYWSGQMMLEFHQELLSGRGPVYLKLEHLSDEVIGEIETILHSNERPSRGRFHEGRGHTYQRNNVEMHVSEVGFCSGHSASGVLVDENACTTVPGLFAGGDMASVPHNYMLGAFVFGTLAGQGAVEWASRHDDGDDPATIDAERDRIGAIPGREGGVHHAQVEYKVRRTVNDYLQPPKTTRRMEIALERFALLRREVARLGSADPHETMRCLEVHSILDCAEMAAHASLFRRESRWGLYHQYMDYPERNDAEWFVHTTLSKGVDGSPVHAKRDVEPYIVEVPEIAAAPGVPAHAAG
jgi:succinate dehydrogenase/fumarate reductase flavoprotein subunit